MVLPLTDVDGAITAVEHVRAAVARTNPDITVSAGVAQFEPGTSDDTLNQRSDAALYEAKRRGRNIAVAFGDVDDPAIVPPVKVRAVRSLLQEGDLGVVFQPIWDLGANRVLGFEALTRPAARYGLDGPFEAFQIADGLGRAHELDDLCRSRILEESHKLPDDALLFINVSPQSLGRSSLDSDKLVREVEAVGLTCDRVVLEITERSMVRMAVVIREAKRLRELGFQLVLDDVGAGNAGLEMLRHLKTDFVKVAREVVADAVQNEGAKAVFAAIISLAHQTNAFVIAEGIENQAMMDLVRQPVLPQIEDLWTVQGVQGYLLGRPSESTTQTEGAHKAFQHRSKAVLRQ